MFRPIAEADRCERYKSQEKVGEDYGLNTKGGRGGQVLTLKITSRYKRKAKITS